MARNVSEFRFLPSKPGTDDFAPASNADTLFPATASGLNNNYFTLINSHAGATQQTGASTVILAPFERSTSTINKVNKYYFTPSGTTCESFSFLADEEYVIEFNLLNTIIPSIDECVTADATTCSDENRFNKMAMFQAGYDHLSVGLRDPSNGNPIANVPDFLFYPPQNAGDANIKRHFKLSVPEDMPACIGITAAFYSEEAYKGHLDFTNFKVYRKADKVYHFDRTVLDYNPGDGKDKAAVKAFELTLGINKRGEVNRVVTVIPVPNNGITGGS
jgi:hypothetical protein